MSCGDNQYSFHRQVIRQLAVKAIFTAGFFCMHVPPPDFEQAIKHFHHRF
jgi:hypothetical protein